MSKYDTTKFYWLQLKEDFFEDDAISWLEDQEPNGRDYAYFYLKLCLKSLKSNGVLIRKVGNILIPYDNKKLAELTKIDYDTVVIAMELLKQIGLVQILENGEIYITQLDNLIGSTSRGAFKKQLQIARRNNESKIQMIEWNLAQENGEKEEGWNDGGKNSTKDKDKVKDKDKIKDIKKEIIKEKETKHKYGEYQNVLLTDKELQSLKSDYDNSDELIKYLDEYIEMKGYKAKSHYLCIKKWVVKAVKQNCKNDIESWLNEDE